MALKGLTSSSMLLPAPEEKEYLEHFSKRLLFYLHAFPTPAEPCSYLSLLIKRLVQQTKVSSFLHAELPLGSSDSFKIGTCLIPSLSARLSPLHYFLIQRINLFQEAIKIPGTLSHYKNKFFQALIPGPKCPVANCTR